MFPFPQFSFLAMIRHREHRKKKPCIDKEKRKPPSPKPDPYVPGLGFILRFPPVIVTFTKRRV